MINTQKKIHNKIQEIVNVLLSPSTDVDPALFGSISGSLIFLFYYGRIYNNQNCLDKANEYLIKIFNTINDTNNVFLHYAEGITGIQTLLVHLLSEGFISEEQFDLCDDIDDVLFSFVTEEINKYEDDFFYGCSGIIYYYTIKYEYTKSDNLRSKLFKIVELLYSRELSNANNDYPYFDLGIPHGYSSLIIILSKIYDYKINMNHTKAILDNLVSHYIPFTEIKKGCGYFPSVVDKRKEDQNCNSRLGWCYGDISCSLALLKYSESINEPSLRHKCLNILKRTCLRINLEDNCICDSGFCHGCAGLSYIYLYLYNKYRIAEFQKAHQYWLDKIFDFTNHTTDGVAGFAAYTRHGYKKRYDLLTGISGIGLVLISGISKKCYSWEKLFLL